MSNYTKTTDFAAKDTLTSGDAGKIIRGSEFETEFDDIASAIATKADTASPTFTGTVTIPTAAVTTFSLGGTTVTSTATELNYVDGVTSAIQTQLDTKAPIASPTFTGTVTVPSLTTTGNVSFGDNDKAVFGASSDLEIYHDGSNSIISDTGTGDIKLRQGLNDKLRITTAGATVFGEITANKGDFNTTETGVLIVETSSTPNSGSIGTAGQITWDSSYLYVCIATNSWKRIALTTIGAPA